MTDWVSIYLSLLSDTFSTSEAPKVCQNAGARIFTCATAACNFSTSELQKVARTGQFFLNFDLQMCFHNGVPFLAGDRQFFSIFSCKCVLCHSRVPFLEIWTSKSSPAMPEPRINEKTQLFATFLTFRACVSSVFWLPHTCDLFLLTWLLSSFSTILSEVRRLNFLR